MHHSKSVRICRFLTITFAIILLAAAIPLGITLARRMGEPKEVAAMRQVSLPAWIEEDIIRINGAARRGVSLEGLTGIVIHYIGNPGTTAAQNRNYFNNPDTTVSAHFVVGLEGEIIQCVPLHEKSSASNHRNADTISIEVCHPDESGVFTDASYAALVRLTAWLCGKCGFGTDAVIRHHDITGKACPLWFVEDPAAWEAFLEDVDTELQKGKQ